MGRGPAGRVLREVPERDSTMNHPSGASPSLPSLVQSISNPATALVLDSGGTAALGVVRSLGRVGVEVWLGGAVPGSPAARSRFAHRRVDLPRSDDADRYAAALIKAIDREARRLVVFCTDDPTTAVVSAVRKRLPGNALVHLPTREVVAACLSRVLFAEWALTKGLPVPATVVCRNATELTAALARIGTPAFVKPDRRQGDPTPGVGTGPVEAYRSHVLSPGQSLPSTVSASLERGEPWVVQEFVPGPVRAEVAVQLYRTLDGDSLHTFVGQKIRSVPPGNGGGVIIRGRSAPSAVRLVDEVVRASAYHGYGLLTFKRHPRSGRLMLLDIVPRYGAWCELAERGGVNLPALAFLDAHGIAGQAPAAVQSDGVYWWEVPTDWSSLRRPGLGLRDRLGCFVPPLGRPVFPRLSFDDPKPALGGARRRKIREDWP